MKDILFILPICIVISGCSITRNVEYRDIQNRDYNWMNYLASQNSSTICFCNNSEIECSFLEVKNDSVYFLVEGNNQIQKFNLDNISYINIDDYKASLFSGFWGTLGGFLVGVAISPIVLGGNIGHPNLGPLYCGLAVSPLGLITGYIIGGKMKFVFNKVEN